MTNEETEVAIQNLIERMNRIKATVMQNRPVVDQLGSAVDNAIATLTRATNELASRLPDQSSTYLTLADGSRLSLADVSGLEDLFIVRR